MKINNINLTLEWQTVRDIPDFLEVDHSFPTYNILIKNENDQIIQQKLNLNYHEPIQELRWEFLDDPYVMKPKFRSSFSKNKTKNIFKYNFEDNYSAYKRLYNKIGFFKKLKFDIDYNNDGKGDFEMIAEYADIEDLRKDLLFSKIYRSSDYLSVKFLINKEYFQHRNIYSFLILSELSNKFIKHKILANLFTEEIKEKWLDVNETTALLTVPFIESDIVEISENINIKIIPLSYAQSEIYKFLKEKKEEESVINDIFIDSFSHQVLNIGKIYKQIASNETLIYYQNYLYLFNKESLTSCALNENLNLNGVNFNLYFPLLNKNQNNKTVCLSDDLNTDDILDNTYNLPKDYLGYYSKDLINYEDVVIDLDYFDSKNISNIRVFEVEEANDTCNIYIEFITTFYNNERFYIESSNNIKLEEKYKTLIEGKEYLTFLFKYTYSLSELRSYLDKNPSINKNQIISEKDLINFSAKIIF